MKRNYIAERKALLQESGEGRRSSKTLSGGTDSLTGAQASDDKGQKFAVEMTMAGSAFATHEVHILATSLLSLSCETGVHKHMVTSYPHQGSQQRMR